MLHFGKSAGYSAEKRQRRKESPMHKYLLLAVSVLATPFMGSKAHAVEKKLNRTVKAAKQVAGKKSKVAIKSVDAMLLASQDITGGDKTRR